LCKENYLTEFLQAHSLGEIHEGFAAYDRGVRRMGDKTGKPVLKLDTSLLRPGVRLAVGVSGGADSVALLRALHARSGELGIVLHAAHLHHGLRGAEADGDRDFARALAGELGIPWHQAQVDVVAEANARKETVEEAARRLRYSWFRELLNKTPLDAIATAHTLDDQAETVLAKLLRGAWTEGLGGIHPLVEWPEGQILRPLLGTRRAEIEAYLKALGQTWREDSSNRRLTYTRNRIRHELLPVLEGWNPQLKEHLAQMAELARDEEAWWQTEMERLAGQILLPGKPVRGGGRAGVEGLAVDVLRLGELPVAVQRRLLRLAAKRLGSDRVGVVALDFAGTEAARALALKGRAGQKRELGGGLCAERTHRELRLTRVAGAEAEVVPEYTVTVPGEIDAPAFGIKLRIELDEAVPGGSSQDQGRTETLRATLRAWRAGDRVRLRYSGGLRKVKEVLERLRVTGSDRAGWPVLELAGRIVWMRGVELEPETGVRVKQSEPQPSVLIRHVERRDQGKTGGTSAHLPNI
jgi:tRNA(Ile)-lysidine synthase